MVPILQAVADDISARAGVRAQLGPQPMELQEPIVTLLYGGIKAIDREYTEEERGTATVTISAVAVLSARGDGPGVYLEMVTEASIAMAIYFERPFSVQLTPSGGHVTVKANRRSRSGATPFFQSDDPGRSDYTFEESYDLEMMFPYSVPAPPKPGTAIPLEDFALAGLDIYSE